MLSAFQLKPPQGCLCTQCFSISSCRPRTSISTCLPPSFAEGGELRSELKSPHGGLPMRISGLSSFCWSSTSSCWERFQHFLSASGWAQGRFILVTGPVIEANEDAPRWCATGCTVPYHPVRRALASILDASLSRLTGIPDDALQFDLVSLSRHNHTPGDRRWREAQVRLILGHAADLRQTAAHCASFSSSLHPCRVSSKHFKVSAFLHSQLVHHTLDVLVFSSSKADPILIPTNLTAQVGGE